MPVPKYSTAVLSVPLAPGENDEIGVTELRVHGVSGTPAAALLADLAPVQVWGDSSAGFYRSSPREGEVWRRNVEAYSWGGLTSGSGLRLLWLVLLPFLLGNLSGWMCSRRTRRCPFLFVIHRVASGLGALALTVNAAFAITLITADVAGYQAPRAGVIQHSWWLAPMGWPGIAGHPARQVLVGILVSALVVLAVRLLVGRSWRYEKVRPPGKSERPGPAPRVTAAALKDGLRDKGFWDGAPSAATLAWVHSAAYVAFLAIVLAVTARSATGGGSAPLGWIAAGAGGTALAGSVLYLVVDAFVGTSDAPGLRKAPPVLTGIAVAGLACAGVFAWLRPATAYTSANLPGIAAVFHWTAIGLTACAVLAALCVLAGLDSQWRSTFAGAPLACLLLGFGLLNVLLLCLLDWIANLAGPVTVMQQAPAGMLYVPKLVWYGAPMLAWALAAAAFMFFVGLLVCWWRARRLPPATRTRYEEAFNGERDALENRAATQVAGWYTSALGEDVDAKNASWAKGVSRWLFIGGGARRGALLVWLIVIFQLAIGLSEWFLAFTPWHFLRYMGTALAALIVPALIGFIGSAWSNPGRRRGIGVIWDVGTFWPRSFHPFAPPCYAEQAVPDLQRRAWWLHDNGGKVIMVAHSQGAILAAAAFAQDDRQPDGASNALVTFGNPLTRLYEWGFPGYITPEFVRPLIPGPGNRLQSWRNYWYETDPIGSLPVTPLLDKALQLPDSETPGDAPATEVPQEVINTIEAPGSDAAGAASGTFAERYLLDPDSCGFVYGTTAKRPGAHSGYWSDPRVWHDIDQVALHLT